MATRTFAQPQAARQTPAFTSRTGSQTAAPVIRPVPVLASPLAGFDFSRLSIGPASAKIVQTNLAVDAPGNPYEREADRIADRVMRMPESRLQRACDCGGDCPKCKEEASGRKRVQTKRVDPNGAAAAFADPIVEDVIHSSGAALDPSDRSYMESRFGHDFSRIRIHTGPGPDVAAKSVRARAFTVGSDIVFASGQYAPHTWSGRHLLAHELTHTLQQNGPSNAPSTGAEGHAPNAEHVEPNRPAAAGVVQRQAEAAPGGQPTPGAQPGTTVSTGALDLAFDALRLAAPLVPGLTPLLASYELIKGVIYLYDHREEMLQQLLDGIDSKVQQIPDLARQKLDELVAGAGVAAEAVSCVVEQMGTFLVSLATNWREVIESFLRDIFFIGLFERSIPTIINNIGGLIGDIMSGEFRAAIDRGVTIMTEVNAIAGVLYLWSALILMIVGAAAGTEVPVAGNAAGGAAGLTLSQVINIGLLSSVIGTETLRVARGIDEMVRNWDNVPAREAGCLRVAEGVFSIALTVGLFFLGPSVSQLAQRIIQRAVRAVVAIARGLADAAEDLGAALRSPQLTPAAVGPGGNVMPFSGPRPGFEPVPGTARAPRPATTVPDPVTVRPPATGRSPATAPRLGPATGINVGIGAAPATEDPNRRRDACRDTYGLVPGNNARWHSPRPPIAGNITMNSAAFRLDAGINPPAGQATTGPSRLWARAMGNPLDDAGHAIARRFGGTAIFNDALNGNIFPQNLSVNRGRMVVRDREAADLHAAGCDVCVHIGLNYLAPTDTRPTEVVHTIMARQPGAPDFAPPTPRVLPNP